jgi:DoxX-like family
MKRNKIIYWSATIIISLMMLLSAYQYLANPAIEAAFQHLGFPSYFRIELAIAKIAGAVLLIIVQVPSRIKEWVYAGFAITFVSAFIAHLSSGEGFKMAIMPVIFLVILLVSNVYLYKLNKA